MRFAGKVNAPEFPAGLEWLNTTMPLTLRELRGKLVILDFWTYCCINCMHVLPQLRKLEEKYRDSLVVIGVHSAKFDAEKSTSNIAEAVRRYEVRHPVVNDARFEVWQAYAARAWPTLMFVDPQGKVIGKHEGEFQFDGLDRVIGEMLDQFDQSGWINRDLLPFQAAAVEAEKRPLSYPGKIEVDTARGRLYIADSGHHRVLVTSLEGVVAEVIGNGEPGMTDGGFGEAAFDNPQGMAFEGEAVLVADAGTHTIRAVDLERRTVTTIAGTGEQALYRHEGGQPLKNPISSPYDITRVRNVLYIAMAGFHQLWSLDLDRNEIRPFAGSGAEGIKDGAMVDAMLAQPYGVVASGQDIFFADCETSALRVARGGAGGSVVTLVGTGLFDFGDTDGIGREARLQHVQGVAMGPNIVYIADTYNNKLKQVPLNTLRVTTLAGDGRNRLADGDVKMASFNEPGGLAFAGDRIFVADTNNHSIRVLHLNTNTVETLEIQGLD